MKVVIIEDEVMAAELIEGLVLKYDPSIEILATLDSIKASAEWFNNNPLPDLVFMDIHLADGLSFEIFDRAKVKCPIIFTTAYNEYAIRAFKVNSIDYLLKPLDFDELKQAIDKFKERFSGKPNAPSPDVFDKVLNMLTNKFKQRFVIKVGEHIRSIPVEDVLYFYSLEKATFLHTATDHNYVIDYSIEQIENLVDPQKFFRINRKYLISLNSFDDIISYSNSRLKIELLHSDEYDVIVAREKVQKFKKWLDK